MDPLAVLDWVSQGFILVIGGAAIWLVGRREAWKRWGYVLGLCSQPFWFYSTIRGEQWGMVVLSLWYTYAWGQGLRNYWHVEKDPAE